MLTPIVCMDCGTSLGDKAPLYHIIRRKRMAARLGAEGAANPANAAIAAEVQNTMGDVLDALRIDKCCRTTMMTTVLFYEHY